MNVPGGSVKVFFIGSAVKEKIIIGWMGTLHIFRLTETNVWKDLGSTAVNMKVKVFTF